MKLHHISPGKKRENTTKYYCCHISCNGWKISTPPWAFQVGNAKRPESDSRRRLEKETATECPLRTHILTALGVRFSSAPSSSREGCRIHCMGVPRGCICARWPSHHPTQVDILDSPSRARKPASGSWEDEKVYLRPLATHSLPRRSLHGRMSRCPSASNKDSIESERPHRLPEYYLSAPRTCTGPAFLHNASLSVDASRYQQMVIVPVADLS
ncbi:hypothetical protein BV20DRAFT_715676 [Pilatotrama ljubarskyi]|nr:hypothetical protein BV20DRAFT_715676 [Pilatotrama ljubarskyi]